MLNRTLNHLVFVIISPLVYLIVKFNPDWLESFSVREKRILDRWIGVEKVQTKIFLLYLAMPFLRFSNAGLRVEVDRKEKISAILTAVFAGLFCFLGSVILMAAYFNPTVEDIRLIVGFGSILLLCSFGFVIANADKYAALCINRLLNN